MDPNANLKEQLELAAEARALDDQCPEDGCRTEEQEIRLAEIAVRLGELVEALHGWLSKGGFLPEEWWAQ